MSDTHATETPPVDVERWAPGAFAEPVLAEEQHVHPTVGTYIKVALVLAALTALEVSLYYLEPTLGPLIVSPLLLLLSAGKFFLVVAFYMHLRYDGRLMTALFTGPLLIATVIILTLMALFFQFVPRVATSIS
ncbi:MAG: cytochrome C oxidase subunit IV family protein [Chloroflexota bacterium]|nr:cytochrome C oxidase subunit IV family protein [Dehalococcoidia bacterium]MDW8254236.1 cytochrome C oxidase subunit IV family protein [Chloroflexota bacterium]